MNKITLKKISIYSFIVIILIVFLSLNYNKFQKNYNYQKTISVNKTIINIEIANTQELKTKGLSGKNDLCSNCGMLFIYDKPDIYTFWMKDMKIPLDFIWINDNKVIELTENVPFPKASDDIKIINPKNPVNNVLEVPAGFIKQNNIKVGDSVSIE